jgi:hypothetical protein
MAKLSLTSLLGGLFSRSALNTNFSKIQTELNDKVLYRDNPSGEPNSMNNVLDMNSNQIINLPTATNATEPVTYQQWVNGQAIEQFTGTLVETFIASAAQTSFTLTGAGYTPGANNLQVYINGVKQVPAAYAETSATEITFTEGLEAGDLVEAIINQRVVDANTVPASSVIVSGSPDSSVQDYLDTQRTGTAEFNAVSANTIDEFTSNTGVTIEGVLLKDSNIELAGDLILSNNATAEIRGKLLSGTTVDMMRITGTTAHQPLCPFLVRH